MTIQQTLALQHLVRDLLAAHEHLTVGALSVFLPPGDMAEAKRTVVALVGPPSNRWAQPHGECVMWATANGASLIVLQPKTWEGL